MIQIYFFLFSLMDSSEDSSQGSIGFSFWSCNFLIGTLFPRHLSGFIQDSSLDCCRVRSGILGYPWGGEGDLVIHLDHLDVFMVIVLEHWLSFFFTEERVFRNFSRPYFFQDSSRMFIWILPDIFFLFPSSLFDFFLVDSSEYFSGDSFRCFSATWGIFFAVFTYPPPLLLCGLLSGISGSPFLWGFFQDSLGEKI